MKTTRQIGDEGEDRAIKFLQAKGYKIIDRNWKNKFCEIDIVARECSRFSRPSNCSIHLVEVKYRKNDQYGAAEEFVDYRKASQLERAAKHWCHENNWDGDIQIDIVAIERDGEDIEFYENITD